MKIPAKLLNIYDDIYLLECLIDSQNKIYEEREFNKSLFDGFPDKIGTIFILELTKLQNEERLKVFYEESYSEEDYFPKIDLDLYFKKSKLFNE
jgi:hypothetical protein